MRDTLLREVAQRLEALAMVEGRSPLHRVTRVLAHGGRRGLLRSSDPVITFALEGRTIEVPFSHQLPFFVRNYPEYGQNLVRLASAVGRAHPHGSVVDVGANVGDTAVWLRRACALPVLCIEGNPAYVPLLQRNVEQLEDVEVEVCFVGDVDAVKGRLVTEQGTARIVDGSDEIAMRSLASILSTRDRFRRPALVKIDTDGFDCRIVRSSLALLRETRSVIFMEYDPSLAPRSDEHGPAFFDAVREAGYHRVLVWDNLGEYMVSVALDDRSAMEDVHELAQRRADRFLDLAFFHVADAGLAEVVRRAENEHFQRVRATQR